MTEKKADIGLIGLAVMGENLVMNMESKGFTVAVFNRTTSKVDRFCEGRAAGKNIIGCHSLQELTEIQARMLDTVCQYVKDGGTLVYSTCSILPEENEMQAEAFLQRHPEFEAVDLPDTVPDKYRQYRKTGLQLLEYRDGVEGFYVCRMRRRRN